MDQKKEARRLNKLKHESERHESRNVAKRYKLPEAAVNLIEKAGPIHGQQSRAIQVAVELLWNMPGWGVSDESMSHILNSPPTGKTYKLPPRTIALINGLAHEYGTKGNVLAAIAYMLSPDLDDSRPDLRKRLTRMPLPPADKVIYEKGDKAETALARDMQRLKRATKRKRRK